MTQFDNGFQKHFGSFQPRELQGKDQQTREDLLAALRLHCLENNFRVLLKYQDVGKPFSHWFTLVAHNKFVEILRVMRHEYSLDEPIDDDHNPIETPGRASTPEQLAAWRQLVAYTEQCLSLANSKCRQMLALAAEECTAIELTLLLHLRPEENKKVADDLRYCRSRLFKCLEDKGITESDWT